ncbi:hypothetical protein PC120_g11363 [Phytophthora cactorum]|nr:hypothetical protein PC120_g11363 [Phytophthora cactorum]
MLRAARYSASSQSSYPTKPVLLTRRTFSRLRIGRPGHAERHPGCSQLIGNCVHGFRSKPEEHCGCCVRPTPSSPATLHLISRSRESTRGEDVIQAFVNHRLKRVVNPAGAMESLTSHIFRRGGAHHANGEYTLAAQWIFNREARKVARVQTGRGINEKPVVEDVETLDHGTQEQVAHLQELLYSSCSGLKERRYNASHKVLAVLTAYLIKYFPELKALLPSAPIVMRVEECLDAAGIARADMLAWSVALNTSPPRHDKQDSENEDKSRECKGCHHSAVINELIVMNKSMAARLTILEAALFKPKRKHAADEEEQQQQQQAQSDQEAKPKRRKKR